MDLTRRRFLAMLFAFLTAQSIVIVILSIFLLSYGKAIYVFSYAEFPVGIYLSGVILLAYF